LFGPLIKCQFAKAASMNAMIRTTTAATMIEGGVSRNVLPTSASAVVNFRILPGHSSAEVIEYVRATVNEPRVGYEENGLSSEPTAVSNTESAASKTLHQTIREIFPDALLAPALAVVTTDSRRYQAIAQKTFRFIPTRLASEDLQRVHGTNERISVSNYAEIIPFFIQQIRNSASNQAND
jgi:carboxypeptidase PM20D1